jgi:hypothetical protein
MRSVPAYSTVAGYPATVIRHYDSDKQVWRIGGRTNKSTRKDETAAPLHPVPTMEPELT